MWTYAVMGAGVLVVTLAVSVVVLAGAAKKQAKKAREAERVAEMERENAKFEKTKNQIMNGVLGDAGKKKNDVRGAGSGADKFNAASGVMRDNKS